MPTVPIWLDRALRHIFASTNPSQGQVLTFDNGAMKWKDPSASGGSIAAPIIVDAAAVDTGLGLTEQTIITTTTTPVANNKYVRLTYLSCYFSNGITGVGLCRLYKNVNGGGEVLVAEFQIERFSVYAHRGWSWIIPTMANLSTSFTIRELVSASGGTLFNASGPGNTNTPARLTIEQFT